MVAGAAAAVDVGVALVDEAVGGAVATEICWNIAIH